jgi:hypothetical protein
MKRFVEIPQKQEQTDEILDDDHTFHASKTKKKPFFSHFVK